VTAEKTICSLFEDIESWKVFASGHAEGRVNRGEGGGLKLHYDFHEGGGFVALRREVAFAMPETFELGFDLKGSGAANDFEFKVADPAGVNVWRQCGSIDNGGLCWEYIGRDVAGVYWVAVGGIGHL
jgi:hypothetical protein